MENELFAILCFHELINWNIKVNPTFKFQPYFHHEPCHCGKLQANDHNWGHDAVVVSKTTLTLWQKIRVVDRFFRPWVTLLTLLYLSSLYSLYANYEISLCLVLRRGYMCKLWRAQQIWLSINNPPNTLFLVDQFLVTQKRTKQGIAFYFWTKTWHSLCIVRKDIFETVSNT